MINYWLCRFVGETRKKHGEPYPPRTIHLILAAWQRKILEDKPNAPKFLDKGNLCYNDLNACDNMYRRLHVEGVGADIKHTAIFTSEE